MINVLIVEDDPMVAEINRRYLERIQGFKLVSIAPNVMEGLKALEKNNIDLLLLDIFMPGQNGLELLSEIRRVGQGVDVIVISAASDISTIKQALRYGAVDYLIKPFEFERFHYALTTYRDEVQILEEQSILSQDELDKLILHREGAALPNELPKGLTKPTLKLVWNEISGLNGAVFSTEELANRVGISRVSMRKYLQFLSTIGVVDAELIYGSVGRPVYKHRCIEAKSHLIKNYL